jgi:3-oxoacyl-[acyl-carrier protein] reductase
MQQYLIIGASGGIGKQITIQLADSGKQVIATFNKNTPDFVHPNIRFHQLDVLEDAISVDDLPEELAGFVYCPGSITLRPFERMKPADFESDYKLQVSRSH